MSGTLSPRAGLLCVCHLVAERKEVDGPGGQRAWRHPRDVKDVMSSFVRGSSITSL